MTISVVIPTYNRVRLLAEAVESVVSQTVARAEIELVIVDDGSTDATPLYLADLQRRPTSSNMRLRVVASDHCGIPGKARNRGVAASRGSLVAFLDSDDLWRPGKLAAQIGLHESGNRLSHTSEIWLRSGREISQATQTHLREGWVFKDALQKCTIGPSTAMISRELFDEFGGFCEELEIAEDYELWLRLTCRVQVAYLDEPYTVKRAGHGDQLSEKHGQIEIFRIRALRGLLDRDEFAGVEIPAPGPPGAAARLSADSLARAELARKLRIYAAGCRKRGRNDEATRCEIDALRYEADIRNIDA